MRYLGLVLALSISTFTHAELLELDNEDLQQVEGQAGADISLALSLNHTSNYALDTNLCGAGGGTATANTIRNCRVGVAFNNRYNSSNFKQWLVFKGIQGTVNIQKMGLDGADLIYNNDSGSQIVKPAIQLSFSKNYPILVRNLGFDTMALETDSAVETSASNVPGYWALKSGGTTTSTYSNAFSNGRYTTPGYDYNREVGFTGVMMNGNLSLNSKLMIFSCDSGHARC